MQTKQALTVFGTFLILYGLFGYIFPEWGTTHFNNNENLFHVLIGILATMLASASVVRRKQAILAYAILFLALGLYGFTLKQPTDFLLNNQIVMQLDLANNIAHIIVGLAFAWAWIFNRTK